jgi:LAO/AO transport system kinase
VPDISITNFRSLARAISLVENRAEGYMDILLNLSPASKSVVIGITGPPGAGKSTLVDALVGQIVAKGKTVGILCVDPSSPVTYGALLGDRIRLREHFNNPNVFIRSLSNRGSLGGLHPSIIEIADVMKAAGFDYILIETVGVGQSEVEIASLADVTVIVLVPEVGDEVQTMKAGLLEVGDIFVVNKSDRPGADLLVKNLRLHLRHEAVVLKTIATEKKGVDTLFDKIEQRRANGNTVKQLNVLVQKAYRLIAEKRMNDIQTNDLYDQLKEAVTQSNFNLYRFIQRF